MVDVVDAVEVGGFRIAFEREGHGSPLLLLHGFVGDGVGTWRYQLETLSDEFTVVAWDAPGAAVHQPRLSRSDYPTMRTAERASSVDQGAGLRPACRSVCPRRAAGRYAAAQNS